MLIKKHMNKKEKVLIECMITSFCLESRLNQAFQLNLVVMSLYLSLLIGIILTCTIPKQPKKVNER